METVDGPEGPPRARQWYGHEVGANRASCCPNWCDLITAMTPHSARALVSPLAIGTNQLASGKGGI
jgi:hypothetical protein